MRVLVHVDLSAPKALQPALKKTLDAIERDDWRSAEVKKLSDKVHYRAKLDREARLILRLGRHGGATVAMALEVLPTHDYATSRFLRGAKLEEADLVDGAPPPAEELPKLRYVHPTRPRFHFLDKPLSFDDEQDAVLRQRPPLIVVGSAGSGKTALLLEKLRSFRGTVGYVTQSAYLAEAARGLYASHGYTAEDQDAEFLSFRELIESIELPVGRPVRFADFAPFFARHQQSLRFTAAHQVFEELRGVLGAPREGPLDLEGYMKLGVRQSLFGPAERPVVHGFFERYRAWLTESGLYDTNLVSHALTPRVAPRFSHLVVDEAQDLTNAELGLVLATLTDRAQFVLAGDANQIVHPNFFSWAGVRRLFFTDETREREAVSVLPANYRNTLAITRVANDLLRVKVARFGSIDRETNHLVRPAAEDAGLVAQLPSRPELVSKLAERIRGSVGCAVLVLTDEQKAEAQRLYRTPLVFSVHEAKGLEYPMVVLHRFVSSEREPYAEIARDVPRSALLGDELAYARARDKEDKSLEAYKFHCNALYVALTRGVERVYLVEDERPHPLLDLLQLTRSTSVDDVTTVKSSQEEWQREARKLELQGKSEQAALIRKDVLKETPVPWEVFDREGYPELRKKAIEQGHIFKKARQNLHEFAAFHRLARLASVLTSSLGVVSQHTFDEATARARARYLDRFRRPLDPDLRRLLDLHGVDFRNAVGLTPLMCAAAVGNVELVNTLLDRGAKRTATDAFGRTAAAWALLVAHGDPGFAKGPFGAVWDRVAPTSIDLLGEGHVVKLGRHQAEYILLHSVMLLLPGSWTSRVRVGRHVTAGSVNAYLEFPDVVLPERRRKRAYWNAVFARAEVFTSYRPARKLLLREHRGEYALNPTLSIRYSDGEDTGEFMPVLEFINLAIHAEGRSPSLRVEDHPTKLPR